ncbi:MAG: hypothetical protein SF052_24345 [Bacteroidia bacterium]|nr:hypothetical protein [Bacteroidia bacterium]
MNFISHFYLDRKVNNSLFFAGVSTPDLVSVFDRNVRLKESRMPLIMENVATEGEISFYNGVMRHFEADRIFHTSTFFLTETHTLSRLIEKTFNEGQYRRAFFVAHVLFELLLDKILIQNDDTLVPEFYNHLQAYPVEEIVRLTEWVTHTSMPSYDGFLKKFIRKKYLYNYVDPMQVCYILRRIVQGVGISQVSYLHSARFLQMIHQYEESLSGRCYTAFEHLNEQLLKV